MKKNKLIFIFSSLILAAVIAVASPICLFFIQKNIDSAPRFIGDWMGGGNVIKIIYAEDCESLSPQNVSKTDTWFFPRVLKAYIVEANDTGFETVKRAVSEISYIKANDANDADAKCYWFLAPNIFIYIVFEDGHYVNIRNNYCFSEYSADNNIINTVLVKAYCIDTGKTIRLLEQYGICEYYNDKIDDYCL